MKWAACILFLTSATAAHAQLTSEQIADIRAFHVAADKCIQPVLRSTQATPVLDFTFDLEGRFVDASLQRQQGARWITPAVEEIVTQWVNRCKLPSLTTTAGRRFKVALRFAPDGPAPMVVAPKPEEKKAVVVPPPAPSAPPDISLSHEIELRPKAAPSPAIAATTPEVSSPKVDTSPKVAESAPQQRTLDPSLSLTAPKQTLPQAPDVPLSQEPQTPGSSERPKPKPTFDAAMVAALLDKRAPHRERTRVASLVGGIYRAHVIKCWTLPPNVTLPDIKVQVALKMDGTFDGAPELIERKDTAAYLRAAASVIDALEKCGPAPLPKEHYEVWKKMEILFQPGEVKN